MRWPIALVVLTGVAHGDAFVAVGAGSSMAHDAPGWALRVEGRFDREETDETRIDAVTGGRVGAEVFGSDGHYGVSMPFGYYAGAQVEHVRTTVGGGIGLWTFDIRDGDKSMHFGVSPFLSGSLETSYDTLLISLDGRVARQIVLGEADFNVYSVVVMLGRRFR